MLKLAEANRAICRRECSHGFIGKAIAQPGLLPKPELPPLLLLSDPAGKLDRLSRSSIRKTESLILV